MMRPLGIWAALLFAAMTIGGAADWQDAEGSKNPTIVYLVRHAETDSKGGRDPELTDVGVERAARLQEVLADESLAAIYCTATKRSHATAAPCAAAFDIEVQDYAPMDGAALRRRITNDHAGERVLVVAHSNTVPMILSALGGPTMPDLGHDEFDRLFVLILEPDRATQTLQLRY